MLSVSIETKICKKLGLGLKIIKEKRNRAMKEILRKEEKKIQ